MDLRGNLWQDYLTYLLASNENAYSTSCEIVGAVDGSINTAALHDFAIFKELFDYDFREMEAVFETDLLSLICDYQGISGHGKVFNQRIRDRICSLSRSLSEAPDAGDFLKERVTKFYQEFRGWKAGASQSVSGRAYGRGRKDRADHKDRPRTPGRSGRI